MPAPSCSPEARLTRGRTLDHAAEVYDLLAPLMTLGQEGRYRKLALCLLDLRGAERVLDVGCGTGVLTRLLAERLTADGACAVGLDAARRAGRACASTSARPSGSPTPTPRSTRPFRPSFSTTSTPS